MKHILQFITLITLAAFSLTTHAKAKPPTTYTQSQTSITVTAQQPTFILKLKSNPTTGYSWALQNYNAKLITSVTHSYQRPTSKLIGAGGFELWTFRVKSAAFKAPRKMLIRMIYARPWEKKKTGAAVVFNVITVPRH